MNFVAGTIDRSCDSVCVQFSTHPVMVMLNLRGRFAEFRIAFGSDDSLIESKDDRRGVEQLRRRQSGKRTAVDVSHIVLPGLERLQIDAAQLLPDFRNGFDRVSAQFNLLACCYVERTVSQASQRSAIAGSYALVANPLGIRIRIINFPGVGLRKKTPTHFSNSLSAALKFCQP